VAGKLFKSGKTFIKIVLLFFQGLLVIALLLSYLSFHISPGSFPVIAFAGLAYPYILLLNVVFILFWLFSKIKFALIPILVVFLGWNHIGRLIQFGNSSKGEPGEDAIKIISYNLQNFLKVNTSTTKYVTDFKNETRIKEFLQDQKADIVCLQEMLYDRKNNKQFTNKLGKTLDCRNYYYENYFGSNNKIIDAIAIFTSYPIIDKGHFVHDGKSIGIYTDLKINEDTLRVYNIHLASIHFKQEDYKFWSEITQQEEQENLKEGTLNIMKKMQAAFIKRSQQAQKLKQHIRQSPYANVICGDFNDTPSSYAYNQLSENCKDAFVKSGRGLGRTYSGELFPAFRIDFILYDEAYQSADFVLHKIPYSDHYPLSCLLFKE